MKRSLAVTCVFIIALLISSGGCVSFYRISTQKQLTIADAEKIISGIKVQDDYIRSFYSLGVVSIKGSILASNADILIAGVKDPFSMKIEITQSWGRPFLHILIREGRLNVVSFQEKVTYSGIFTPEAFSKFLPGLNLDQEMIWPILSGRPPVISHEVVRGSAPGIINLMSKDQTEIEVIHLPLEGSFPTEVAFPPQSLKLFFSDIKEESGISYAGEIKLKGKILDKDLALKIDRIAFNAAIPDKIFELEKPSSYETVNLDDIP